MTGANSSSSLIRLGKNEKSTTVLSPLLVMSRGFFFARIKNGRDAARRAAPTNEKI
jgi:hypothetical protein